MLTFVLVCNVLIGLICLVVAWQLWQLKSKLAQVSETLLSIERTIYNIFHPAPGIILKGKVGMHQLRQNYQGLEPQLQRLRQVLALVGFGQAVWQRRSSLRWRTKPGRKVSTRSLR